MQKIIWGSLVLAVILGLSSATLALPDSQIVHQTPVGSYAEFLRDFQQVGELTEDQLDLLISRYSSLLTPGSDTTMLANSLQGLSSSAYPLESLKAEEFYLGAISRLVTSENKYNRIFAYAVLSAADDHRFNGKLRQAMAQETEKGPRLWAGMALLHLQDDHTSELFDFLVENEDFRDPHLAAMYFKLPSDNLRATAYEKIDSKNIKARMLAMHSLALTGLNPETDRLVRDAVRHWEPDARGYAIAAMARLGMSNLAELLRPMANDKKLKRVVMLALANSSDTEDQEFLAAMVENPENLENVLDAYFLSTRLESVRLWLKMVRDGELPEGYTFFTFKQPLLRSNELHGEVLKTLAESKDAKVSASLVRALKGREDSESVECLVGLLVQPDSSVRYWSADALEGVRSPLLVEKLPALIENPKLRTSALTSLAITNGLDNLQEVYLPLFRGGAEREWRRSAAEYLAVYPGTTDASVFREALLAEEDPFTKRDIVIALAKVGVEKDSELIVKAMREEPPSDHNAVKYLIALSILKGDQSRAVLESYRNSSDEQIREFVREILEAW